MNAANAPRTRPRLRGVFHLYAFIVFLGLGALLIADTADGRARFAATVYATAVAVMFGASAFHHRITWTPAQRRWTRRSDIITAGRVVP